MPRTAVTDPARTNGHLGSAPSLVVREMLPAPGESVRGQRRRLRLELALRIVTPILVVVAWQLTSTLGILDSRYFPGPLQIWSSGVDLVTSGKLWAACFVSGRRVLWGFLLGSAVGFLVGFVLGVSRLARAALEPVVYGFWTIPKLAVLPLLFLIFGFGDKPLIVLVVLNTSFLVTVPTMSAIAGVPVEFRDTARSFQANRLQLATRVLIPYALPDIFVSLKIAAGASVLVVVAAEFVNGNTGIGYLIWNSWQIFNPKPMYVGIFVVSVLGACFTLLIGAVGRRLAPWSSKL